VQLLLKIKPHYFFLLAALYFHWKLDKLTPPLQVPDEFNHFYKALQISEGQFLPVKQDNRLGGVVPASVREFVLPYGNAATNLKYTLTQKELYDSFKIKYSNSDTIFYDFPNTAIYSPVSYFPQALAIYVLKKFDCPVASLYYGGRNLIFICWLFAMFFVIKMIPYGKWLVTLLILLPMNMYIMNSFSADTVTNIISLLFISYVLKLSQQEKKINYGNILLLLGMITILAFAKVVYIGLVLLLFVIPPKQFKSLPYYIFSLLILFVSAFLITYYWSNLILTYYTPYANYNEVYRNGICLSNCANYYLQKELILNNKMYFIDVIYKSILQHPFSYLNGYIGLFGNMDILLPKELIYYSYTVIGLVAITEYNEKVTHFLYKIIFIIAGLAAFIFLLLSQHLTWDCVGEGIVDLLQGRYLIPILPLLFLVFSNSIFKVKLIPNIIVMIFVCYINRYSAKTIYNRFFVESYDKKTEFYCGGEELNEKKNFKTTNEKIELEGASSQTDSVARTGKHSIVLSIKSPYSLIYKFKNLEYGDLIEISAWEKGSGAQFVLAGECKNKKLSNFYIPNSFINFRDNKGWGYINMVQTVTMKCDSSNVSFFVWNPDSTSKIYIDDFRFSIKKFKDNYQDSLFSKIAQMNSSRLK